MVLNNRDVDSAGLPASNDDRSTRRQRIVVGHDGERNDGPAVTSYFAARAPFFADVSQDT
jgi:hypothetical protein